MNNDTLFWYICIPLAIAISEYLFFGRSFNKWCEEFLFENGKTTFDYIIQKLLSICFGTLLSIIISGIVIGFFIEEIRNMYLWIIGITSVVALFFVINILILKHIEKRGK